MNKKLLALKVSKHPLITRLSESIDSKILARLIVEELMVESDEKQESAIPDFLKNVINQTNYKVTRNNSPAKMVFEGFDDDGDPVISIVQNEEKVVEDMVIPMAFVGTMTSYFPENPDKISLPIEDNDKEIFTIEKRKGQKLRGGKKQTIPDEKLKQAANTVADQAAKELPENPTPEETTDTVEDAVEELIPSASLETKEIIQQAAEDKLSQAPPQSASEPTPKPTETSEKVEQAVDAIVAQSQEELPENPTREEIGSEVEAATKEMIPDAPPETQLAIRQKVLDQMMQQGPVLGDTEKQPDADVQKDEPNEPSKELYQIDDAIKGKFIDAADNFQNEFYNQRYRRDQAAILRTLIDAISDMTEDGNLAMAFGDVEDEESQQNLQEAKEEISADDKQVKQLKMDFRSLLSDINKTSKSLKKFEEVAKKGSVLTDSYKKAFMELLASLQKTLMLVVRDMLSIMKKPQTVQEAKEESEKMKKFRTVKKAYSNAVKGIVAVRDLLGDETPDEKPENIIGDTYQAVINLSQYFPSINPFNKGAKTKQDYENYSDSFKVAVKSVKSSLGNVLNFVKQGETGEATIKKTVRDLKEFSAKIASIFGAESQFEDKKIESDAPAAKDSNEPPKDTEPKEQPPRAEVYFEDDELEILEDDTKRQQAISEKIQALKLEDENQTQALQKLINFMIVHLQQKKALQEQEKEPFDSDLVDNAFKVAYGQLSRQEKESVKEIIKKDELGVSGLQKITSSIIAAVMIEGAVQQIKAEKPELEDAEIIDFGVTALMGYDGLPIQNILSGPIESELGNVLDVGTAKQVAGKIKQAVSTTIPAPPKESPSAEQEPTEDPKTKITLEQLKEMSESDRRKRLQNVVLENMEINLDLDRSNFKGSEFKNVKFRKGTKLKACQFKGATFKDCQFILLESSDNNNIGFKNAKFINCTFSSAKFKQSNFEGCKFKGGQFTGRYFFKEVNFENAVFDDIAFISSPQTHFVECDFHGADLSKVKSKNFKNVKGGDSYFDGSTKFPEKEGEPQIPEGFKQTGGVATKTLRHHKEDYDTDLKEQIANKLKPLIREILRR